MKIQDIKEFRETQHPPLALPAETSLREALHAMADKHYGAVAVTENGQYAGLFTESVLLNDVVSKDKHVDDLTLGDVMHRDAPVAKLDDDALEHLEHMNDSTFRYMAVVDDKKKFVGMLSEGNLATYTAPQALAHAAEISKVTVAERPQPFSMIVGFIVYTILLLIVFLVFL